MVRLVGVGGSTVSSAVFWLLLATTVGAIDVEAAEIGWDQPVSPSPTPPPLTLGVMEPTVLGEPAIVANEPNEIPGVMADACFALCVPVPCPIEDACDLPLGFLDKFGKAPKTKTNGIGNPTGLVDLDSPDPPPTEPVDPDDSIPSAVESQEAPVDEPTWEPLPVEAHYITPPPQLAIETEPAWIPPPLATEPVREQAVDVPPEVGGRATRPWKEVAVGAVSISLALGVLFYFFTRLAPHDVLGGLSRRRIMDHLRANPWSSLTQVANATRTRRTTAAYHIRVLARHGHVVASGARLARRFAVRGEPSAPSAPQSLILLAREAKAGPQQLSRVMRLLGQELGISRFGAWKAVQSAATRGHVRLVRSGRSVWVYPFEAPKGWNQSRTDVAATPSS